VTTWPENGSSNCCNARHGAGGVHRAPHRRGAPCAASRPRSRIPAGSWQRRSRQTTDHGVYRGRRRGAGRGCGRSSAGTVRRERRSHRHRGRPLGSVADRRRLQDARPAGPHGLPRILLPPQPREGWGPRPMRRCAARPAGLRGRPCGRPSGGRGRLGQVVRHREPLSTGPPTVGVLAPVPARPGRLPARRRPTGPPQPARPAGLPCGARPRPGAGRLERAQSRRAAAPRRCQRRTIPSTISAAPAISNPTPPAAWPAFAIRGPRPASRATHDRAHPA
jgi:hypothetical protein